MSRDDGNGCYCHTCLQDYNANSTVCRKNPDHCLDYGWRDQQCTK